MSSCLSDLQARGDNLKPLMLLIDPMVGEPLNLNGQITDDPETLKAMRETAWQREVTRIELHPSVPLRTSQHPYLVELDGTKDAWVPITIEKAEEERKRSQLLGIHGSGMAAHQIGGWLQTSQYPHELATQLASLMRFSATGAVAGSYLRLADRRVLTWLRCILGDDVIRPLLYRLDWWASMDILGQLQTLDFPEPHQGAAMQERHRRITLSFESWRRVRAGQDIQVCAAMWLGQLQADATCTTSLTATGVYLAAEAAFGRAQEWAKRFPLRLSTQRSQQVLATAFLMSRELDDMMSSATPLSEWLQAKHRTAGERVEPLHEQTPELLRLIKPAIDS